MLHESPPLFVTPCDVVVRALGAAMRRTPPAGPPGPVVVRPRWSGSTLGGGIGLVAGLAGIVLAVGGILSGIVTKPAGVPSAPPAAERTAQPPGGSPPPPTPVRSIAPAVTSQDGAASDALVTWSPERLELGEAERANPRRGA